MRGLRSTHLLIAAFLAALLTLWGLERAGVLTEAERARRRDRVLPDLIDVDSTEARRVEIARGEERLVFDRRGPFRWTLADPPGVEAAPQEVERLVATLRGLRGSPEAGDLDGPASSYGLSPPAAVVRLWSDPANPPIATLEIGREAQRERFVRSGPSGPVAVVPARVLAAVERPAVEWREAAPVPSWVFPVAAVTIQREGLDATAERDRHGAWRLTSPVRFPADGPRIERLLEALGALRVNAEAGGFVVDRAADLAPFGLAPPVATIELKPAAPGSEPLTLAVGSSPPDRPDDVHVRLPGLVDAMIVPGRFLRELPETLNDLRSRRVVDLDPATVDRVEIDGPGGPLRLERDRRGWMLTAPVASRADQERVEALLFAAANLYALDFLDPKVIGDAGVDPPARRLRIWRSSEDGGASAADSEPALSLAIGRHDPLRKVVLARVEGDPAILALPEQFLTALPTTPLALRDLALPTVQPTSVTRLTIVRPGRTTVLEPADPAAAPNRWRMIQPVAAEADFEAVTAALVRLSELRASSFVAEAAAEGDLARFGLEKPLLEVRWESTPPGSLRVGSPTPDDPSRHHGALAGLSGVFTIDAASLAPFGAEFHDTRVLSFRPEAVRRLVLRSETRSLAFRHRPRPGGGPASWIAEPGESSRDVDLSRFDSLVGALSQLKAIRFIQYEGPFPPGSGLRSPRLTVAVEVESRSEPARLRIGSKFLGDWVCAAIGDAPEGPAFLLQGPAWEELIADIEGGLPPIPDNPFAPPAGP